MQIKTLKAKSLNPVILIAEVKNETDTHVTLVDSTELIMAENMSFQFAPWAMFSKANEVTVPKSDFYYCDEVEDEIAQKYKQAVGKTTIITNPNAGKIIK